VPHKFQVGDKVWLHLQKERLTGPHRKLFPLRYGPYTITKAMGDNSFELNIPPFLGLHLVFNVDLLRPYFPPLLDTSEVAEQLTPTELNPDCIQQASNDHIMDTQIKGTRQQRIQLYRVVKAGQLLHQGKWLTRGQIQQKFPHLMGDLNTMETILPKEGGLIHMDIGGHPPFPIGSKQFSGNFGNLLFLAVLTFGAILRA
jgi:hypothetical protein